MLVAATLILAACGSKSAPKHTMPDQTPAATTTAATMPAATPAVATSQAKEKPQYGTYGFDTAGMDTKVKPGDSFYRYANGTWLDKTQIPADKSNYGMFSVLSDQSDERTKEIILNAKGAAGSEERKIADYYAAFMDEAAIEKAGMDPLKPELDAIAKLKTTKDVTVAVAACRIATCTTRRTSSSSRCALATRSGCRRRCRGRARRTPTSAPPPCTRSRRSSPRRTGRASRTAIRRRRTTR